MYFSLVRRILWLFLYSPPLNSLKTKVSFQSPITVLCEAESICCKPLCRIARLWASVDWPSRISHPTMHWDYSHVVTCLALGNLWGIRTQVFTQSEPSTLPTEPSSQCRESVLLYPRSQNLASLQVVTLVAGYLSALLPRIFSVNCVLKNQLEETRSWTANCLVDSPS